ncbi:hypothetical protein JEQ12_000218, partial [Ovis aries]
MVLSAKKEMDSRSTHVCHDKMYVKCDITEVKKNPLSFKDRKKFEKYPQVITKIFFVMWEELEVDFFFLTPQLPSKLLRLFPLTESSHSALWKGIASNTIEKIPVDPQSNDPSQSDKQDVLCMCFSPSEETLIASTSKSQLYSITMSLTEISKMSLAAALPASFLVTTGQIWIQFLSTKNESNPYSLLNHRRQIKIFLHSAEQLGHDDTYESTMEHTPYADLEPGPGKSCLGFYEDLAKCFQDPEYESILVTALEGLHTSPVPKRILVVGAGMSGLTAAKALQDAGHQ